MPETETLKQFRRVAKYANETKTVSMFYFSFKLIFISSCATASYATETISTQQPVHVGLPACDKRVEMH